MDAEEKTLLTSVLIGCVFVAIVITYFVITIIRQQRRSQRLYKERLLAEITTLEKERARIASDLHDELGPILLAAKYNMNSLDIHSEEDLQVLEKTNKNIDASISRIREISNNLLPEALLRKGLIVALEESIENLKKISDLTIVLHYETIPVLPQDKLINIYRILQEIIHNTIKHSAANKLTINLDEHDKKLSIVTIDDGKGFDFKLKIKENKGLGLRNLFSRTEILEGNMYVDSSEGKGVKLTFEIPV